MQFIDELVKKNFSLSSVFKFTNKNLSFRACFSFLLNLKLFIVNRKICYYLFLLGFAVKSQTVSFFLASPWWKILLLNRKFLANLLVFFRFAHIRSMVNILNIIILSIFMGIYSLAYFRSENWLIIKLKFRNFYYFGKMISDRVLIIELIIIYFVMSHQ